MPTGGSIQSISLNGRAFSVTSDSEPPVSMGGKQNEVMPNGDGKTARVSQKPVPWKIGGVELSIDWSAGDMQYLQNLADNPTLFPIVMTLADLTELKATGVITGDFTGSTMKSTASVELSGPGSIT